MNKLNKINNFLLGVVSNFDITGQLLAPNTNLKNGESLAYRSHRIEGYFRTVGNYLNIATTKEIDNVRKEKQT